jgi:branched-chain amino acid transport system substrate-binding protein
VFTNMWGQLATNKSVGGLFPNDGDGNAWGDKQVGFPPVLDKLGYKLTDPGRYQNLTDNFTAQITAFKRDNCEIVTGVVLPPDFTTFWNQAGQQGFRPKIA